MKRSQEVSLFSLLFPYTTSILSYPVDKDIFWQLCVGICDLQEGIQHLPTAHLIHHLIKAAICMSVCECVY